METIPLKELRNNVSGVLRRVDGGETFLVTVSGRPVAELAPVRKARWVSGKALAAVWASPAPRAMGADLERFGGMITDPYRAG